MGFRVSDIVEFGNGCYYTSYGNGAAYSLKFREYDGWVTEETAFLQRDLHVQEFESLLDATNTPEEVFNLWQRYHYGELPTDYEVLVDRLFNASFDAWQDDVNGAN